MRTPEAEGWDRANTRASPHETTVVPVPPLGDQQAMSIETSSESADEHYPGEEDGMKATGRRWETARP